MLDTAGIPASTSPATVERGHDISAESDDEDEDTMDTFIQFEEDYSDSEPNYEPQVAIILPRRQFSGARNVATIKDGE